MLVSFFLWIGFGGGSCSNLQASAVGGSEAEMLNV